MFPSQTLEKAVRDEIAMAISDRPTPQASWEPEVDSLVMVRVVLRVEEEAALNLPDDLMPAGGFNDIEHCVKIVMEKTQELWNAAQQVSERI